MPCGASVTAAGNLSCTGSFNTTGAGTTIGTNGLNTNGGQVTCGTVSGTSLLGSVNVLAKLTYPCYYGPGGTDNYFQCDGTWKYHIEQGTVWYHVFGQANGARQWLNNTVWGMTLDRAGTLQINGNAYKPGGGAWLASSDARIKTVHYEYGAGLEEVLQLRPVVYTYNGNDTITADFEPPVPPAPEPPPEVEGVELQAGPKIAPLEWHKGAGAPYKNSMHALDARDQKMFVGLVAQEVEAIFPSMVIQKPGFIDGEAVTDLREHRRDRAHLRPGQFGEDARRARRATGGRSWLRRRPRTTAGSSLRFSIRRRPGAASSTRISTRSTRSCSPTRWASRRWAR